MKIIGQNKIKIEDMMLEKWITNQEIQFKLRQAAVHYNEKFRGKKVSIFGILTGVCYYLTDFTKYFTFLHTLDFLSAASYHGRLESKRSLRFNINISSDLKDAYILILDDIADTMLTYEKLNAIFESQQPASLDWCFLLRKDKNENKKYDGLSNCKYLFDIPDRFALGYGLDYDYFYRNLTDIYLKEDK